MTRRATLADVARHAGVSSTTASYILNNRSVEMRIASDTQEKVRAAMAELDYRPNRYARSLRTSRTGSLGVITDFVAGGQFSSQMLTGASECARHHDCLLMIGESGGDRGVEQLIVEEMVDRQVDGFIYATRTHLEVEVPGLLRKQRTVLLNCLDPASGLPSLVPDEQGGGAAAAGALVEAGIDGEIWLVGQDPTPGARAGRLRRHGIVGQLAARGRQLAGTIACDWSVESAFSAVLAHLRNGVTPRGLICLNDRIGMGTYQALNERGLVIPDDVAVVSFDGSALAAWQRPTLASVRLPFAELGAGAVTALMESGWSTTTRLLPMSLVPGGSLPANGSS